MANSPFDALNEVKKQVEQRLALPQIGIQPASPQAESSNSIPRLTTDIDGSRWNEVHTYYFGIAIANEDGSVSNKYQTPPTVNESGIPWIQKATNPLGDAFEVENDPAPNYKFTKKIVPLMIPPQAISVNVQFASNVSATNRGILEENNGVVFRTISITGTTGVWKARPSNKETKTPASGIFKIAEALFPSAVNAVNDLRKAASGIFGSRNGSGDKANSLPDEDLKNTGYYQFWTLHNFFMEYAHNKKQKGARNLRLLFASPKDNITYIVTPVSFDLRRDAGNPLHYKYSIQLRAWDITTATSSLDASLSEVPDGNNPLSVRGVAERIRRLRRTINKSANVIKAVQSDVFEALNVVNQATLAVKDVVGLGNDLLDFAPTLKNSVSAMVESNKNQWSQIFQDKGFEVEKQQSFNSTVTGGISTILAKDTVGPSGSGISTKGKESASVAALKKKSKGDGEVEDTTTNSGPTGESDSPDNSDAASVGLITEFLSNPEMAEATQLEDLGTLPEAVQISIDDQKEKSKEITGNDIHGLAQKLKEVSENLAYANGLMDENYAKIHGLPEPKPVDKKPTEEDLLLIADIEDGRDALLASLATDTVYGEKKDDPFVDANKATAEKLPTPLSAIPVFMQRGSNLDDMAKLYLGDANRAKEIAILNELRAPYIDEEGFNLPISLASGRSFVVNDRKDLVLNQKIRIHGNGIAVSRRTILAIEPIGGGQYKVTVDGKPNLDLYNSASAPFINARQPGTVGSGDTILIPTANAPDTPLPVRTTPLLQRLSHAEQIFRVDMALDENGDLAVGSDGDFSRSYGYQNAVQALRIAVETEQGELEQHPAYGISAGVGDSLNSNVVNEISQSVQSTILSDSRFQNADVNAELDGTALRIRVDAVGSNGTGLIPVEFKVET